MNIVPVRVSGKNGKEVETYAFLDSGSNSTMCSRRLLDMLNLTGDKIEFTLSTINGKTQNNSGSVVSLSARPLDGAGVVDLPHVIRGRRGEPSAVKTVLGWSLFGTASSRSGRCSVQHVQVNHVNLSNELLHQQVKIMWETEFKDSSLGSSVGMSNEDKYAMKLMNDSVKLEDKHYCLRLPWRTGSPILPNNRTQAVQRLSYLKRRLNNDSHLCQKYKETINGYLKNGYAQRLKADDQKEEKRSIWYLPHHPVLHPHKPGKVRVVFDCAAKFRDTSLNKQLLQGPDMMNSLVGVLLRFRQEAIAIVADVEAMFHQVRVDPRDIDCLRFVWWPDGDMSREPVDFQMLVHLFGATSSPCCASFSLRRTADDNCHAFSEETVATVRRNFYVDDCLKSVATLQEAKQLVQEIRALLQRGGFHLRKWLSNDERVLDDVPKSDSAKTSFSLKDDTGQVERVLGVSWNYRTDTFQFDVKVKEKPITRRGILSVVSSLFDPLGFVAPVVLQARMLLQELCRQGVGWDEEVPEDIARAWRR
uniref:Uncharacterized protein LOC108949296 n=1 Tax=Phallusia mammillata TaxID=59560 RepID=A0A6F9DJD4_9ASCI|nr:uncharacterized protein LOC108949296 [Phallusia mammillata]